MLWLVSTMKYLKISYFNQSLREDALYISHLSVLANVYCACLDQASHKGSLENFIVQSVLGGAQDESGLVCVVLVK